MRYSQSFLKTTKDTPKEAELVSHRYLLRGGFVAHVGSGIYTLLPLGYRVVDKITQIVLEELRKIGVEDIRMPIVHPARPWKDSGRFYEDIDVLWKVKNNSEEDFVLAMTGEEIVTDAAKKVISSYKDLPKLVGQIGVKVRDEARARGGLLRLREFMMQDAYSFDRNEAEQEIVYQKFITAYKKIFERLEVPTVLIESDAGAMGGSGAHEFMMIAESGEDWVIGIDQGEGTLPFYFNGEKIGATKDDSNEVLTNKLLTYIKTNPRGSEFQTKLAIDEVVNRISTNRGIEVANIFKLGTKYSAPQKLLYLDENNQQQPVIMGSYGIGVDRLVASIVEASHDDKGIIWPVSVSPYLIYLISIGEDVEVQSATDMLYENLKLAGIEVFYDDRLVSAGEKFADADLMGITWRVTVSKKTLAEGSAEIKRRNWPDFKLEKIERLVEEAKTWGPDGENIHRTN